MTSNPSKAQLPVCSVGSGVLSLGSSPLARALAAGGGAVVGGSGEREGWDGVPAARRGRERSEACGTDEW